MAINPESQYPGKINPSDADYPYGSARNVTVPGDGTGTPWEAAFVKDLMGLQQELLTAAGIVPSGTPDKVGASQYVSAIRKLINNRAPAVFANIADMQAGSLVGGGETITLAVGQPVIWLYDSGLQRGEYGVGVVTPNNTALAVPELYISLGGGLYVLRLNVFGNVAFETPNSATDSHMLVRSINDGPTRVHQEPRGDVDDGTVTKYDWMLDPYDDDPANYRIGSVYTYVGDPNGTGEPGVFVINSKNAGSHWGVWTPIHIGHQDDGATSVAMKVMYVDFGSPEWYTPMRGGWRTGKAYTAGDYITASNKVYQATMTGTSGGTIPSHSSGTASDGGVTWQHIHTPNYKDVRPCVVFGDRDDMPVLGQSDSRVQFLKSFLVNWGANQKFINVDGDLISQLRGASSGGGAPEWLYIEMADGALMRFHKDENYMQFVNMAQTYSATAYTAGETTVSVQGTTVLSFGNSSATTVTQFTNGKAYQEISVFSSNGQTTIQHNANIRLKGGVNRVLDANTVIKFIADGTGNVFRQVTE